MSCFFCERYLQEREYDECRRDVNEKLHHEYGVILLKVIWNEIAGRHHWSEDKVRPLPEGFKLRYCPECGRRLEP